MKKLSVMALIVLLTACSGGNEASEQASSQHNQVATKTPANILEKEIAEKKAMIAKERVEKETIMAREKAEKEAMLLKQHAEKDAAQKKAMIAKERAQKEAAEKDAMATKEASNREALRLEAERQEVARQEAIRQEAARQEAERQAALRQEAARQETVRVEAARIEAERVEAARIEAERIEAEKAAAAASAYKVISSSGWRKKSYSVAGKWSLSSENGVMRVNLDSQFSTRRAPDLKIFLSPLSPDELTGRNATQGALLISPLQSNRGAQSYTVPAGTNLSRYKTILIHCEAFSKLWSVSGL